MSGQAVQLGDFGDVLVDGCVLAEYDDDQWDCVCHERGCARSFKLWNERPTPARGRVRINLLGPGPFCDGDSPCGQCGCDYVALCYRDGGAPNEEMVAEVELSRLAVAGEQVRRRGVTLLAGPCIYVAQLMPDVAPRRLKVGYSANVADRLRSYRSGCPTAQMIAVRVGDLTVESALIRCFEARYRQVGPEVFDVDDVDAALRVFAELD